MRLLRPEELPSGFSYPDDFMRIVEHGLVDLEPWWILAGDEARTRARGLSERFPQRTLVPFARRQDNDDVACFEMDGAYGPVVIIHDFATPGWEQHASHDSAYGWLQRAIAEFAEFD